VIADDKIKTEKKVGIMNWRKCTSGLGKERADHCLSRGSVATPSRSRRSLMTV
jgi:hypothetical protein